MTQAIPQELAYRLLKSGRAAKISPRATSLIGYQIIGDADHQHLWLRITDNVGGCFSNELVPFSAVQACIEGVTPEQPILSKVFAKAFVGRSSNHGGFTAAILRAEELLAPFPCSPNQHAICGDWAEFQRTWLAEEGTPLVIASKEKPVKSALVSDAERTETTPATGTSAPASPPRKGKGRKGATQPPQGAPREDSAPAE